MYRVWGVGFRVQGLAFRVWVQGLGCSVLDFLEFRVQKDVRVYRLLCLAFRTSSLEGLGFSALDTQLGGSGYVSPPLSR